jgi:hypothetical protein
MERTDEFGTWQSDDGRCWVLTEPSQAFLDLQIPDPLYAPLDSTGTLATLLVVVGTLDLQDAANAIHEEPSHLIHEAESWALGG